MFKLLLIAIYVSGVATFSPTHFRAAFRGRSSLDMGTMGEISKVSLKVSNLQKSLNFYTKAVGMEVVNGADASGGGGKVALSFGGSIALELEESASALDEKSKGDGFYGIGVAFPNAQMICDAAVEEGGSTVFPFGNYAYGASLIPDEDELKQYPISYGRISDPDGYVVEVVNEFRTEPFMKVMLNVLDLDEAIDFYTKGMGMTLFRKRSNVNSQPKVANFVGYVGAGDTESDRPYIELIYKYARDKINIGSCLNGISIEGGDKQAAVQAGGVVDADATGSSVRDVTGYPLQFV